MKAKAKFISGILVITLIFIAAFWSVTGRASIGYAMGTATSIEEVQETFPHYPRQKSGGSISMSVDTSESSGNYNSISVEGFRTSSGVGSEFALASYKCYSLPEGATLTLKKSGLEVRNVTDGNPLWIDCDAYISFQNLATNPQDGDMTPVIAVQSNTADSNFYMANIAKMHVWIMIKPSSGSGDFRLAIGFEDIDVGQECWMYAADLASPEPAHNNKYWYGSKIDYTYAGGWHKFAGTEVVDNYDEEAMVVGGMNLRSGRWGTCIFTTTSRGPTFFNAEFWGRPDNPSGEETITYKIDGREWADGSKTDKVQKVSFGFDTQAIGNDIKTTYTNVGDTIVVSEFAGNADPYKGWYDDTRKSVQAFTSGNQKYVYWYRDNRDVYPKFNEREISIPAIGIVSAAADMGMSGGYAYRTKTDVIFSVKLTEGGKNNLPDEENDPDTRITAKFTCLGNTYTVTDIVIPKSGSQLVWIKFHTPDTAQNFTINVNASFTFMGCARSAAASFPVSVTEPVEKTPPDPRAEGADGKAIQAPASFNPYVAIPTSAECLSKSWSVWNYSEGSFSKTSYSASLTQRAMTLEANEYVKTAEDGGLTIKSGYGFDTIIKTQVGGSPGGTANVTPIQSGRFLFPEFGYGTYDRLAAYLERTSLAASTGAKTQHFKVNKYSPHAQEVHFTPLWYPDGPYRVSCYIRDAWTPAGELTANLSAQMYIEGNLYEDWHVAPKG
ncbi:MAG: hypothetical protein LBC58_06420 [Clostridiales Family XIII bacterium]|jgi:hypothetical protein|nr:hypothetical protein [Clostridiales Family XIII bacterium]